MGSTITDRLAGVTASLASKAPVRAATTANITLSGAQTIDAVAVVADDRVLVKNQTDGTENGIYCVDPETEILTRRGFKRYAQLSVGEDVFTLNLETGGAEWQPALAVHSFDVEGIEMLSMEAKSHSSLSTMNHRWPVSRRFPPIENYPRARYADGTFAPYPEPLSGPFLTIRESSELTSEDYIVTAAPCANLPTVPTHANALVELVGWFITEGHIRKNNSGTLSTCVDIVQSIAVNPEYVDRIRQCLADLFGAACGRLKRPRGGVWKPEWREVLLRNGRMVEFVLNREAGKILCGFAPERVAKAEFIASLTAEQLNLFVDTCIAADGTVIDLNKQRVFVQKKPAMLAPVQMACTLLGLATNVSVRKDGVRYMTLLQGRRTLSQRRAKSIRYTGKVWCPETKNGTWLARRSGSCYFTGNTAKSGAWVRSLDFDGTRDVVSGTFTIVAEGTAGAGTMWFVSTTGDITIGTTSIAFTLMTVETASAFMLTVLDDANSAAALATLVAAGTAIANTFSAIQTFSAQARWNKGADIASASPLVLGTDGNYFDVTGTTGFSAITVAAGTLFMLQFDGVLTMTHGASLDLPGEANFTTAAGDRLIGFAEAGNTVQVLALFKADGTALVGSAAATQAEMETATSITTVSTPGRQQFHPGHPKAWVNFNGTGTVAIREDYNVSSITDDGIGLWTVNWDTDFSATTYSTVGMAMVDGTALRHVFGAVSGGTHAPAVGSAQFSHRQTDANTSADAQHVFVVAYGDQ